MTSDHPGVILRTESKKIAPDGSLWESLRQQAARRPARVILVEPEDPRVLSAASYLLERRLAVPVFVGNSERVEGACRAEGLDLKRIECLDPQTHAQRGEFENLLFDLRKAKGLTREQAHELISDPVYFGVMALRAGLADTFVGGAVRTTADTVRAGFAGLGIAHGAEIAFGAFLMDCPHGAGGQRALLFADCAVSPRPSPRALAAIGIGSAKVFEKWTGQKACVAFLSFSTRASAADESVDAVRHAVDLARKRAPDLDLDGELQGDAALESWVARQKGAEQSTVEGRANVLIFPDLNAGNIAYKLVRHLGGARAVGPVVAGLSRPFSDLSRGCTDEDIVDAAVLTALL
ncbi:MAG: phosphotransacetylase [Elusimicrobia bacterium]|nr:phosphotransacetylase [Elusimicrobiota bacterium]